MGTKILEKIFSLKNVGRHKVITFLGIKLKIKRESINSERKKQDKYDLTDLKNSKKLIVFFEAQRYKMCGGQMSIFSLCKYSKQICTGSVVLMATLPGRITYAHNDFFENELDVHRWEQIIKNIGNKEEVILHMPESHVDIFKKNLSQKDIKILKKIPNLQINLLNQCIDAMPPKEELSWLFDLTHNVTQTVAHDRYATQEICDKWEIPTHLFSVRLDLTPYKPVPFEKKEKIILFSPDGGPEIDKIKNKIIKKLMSELPEYDVKMIWDMTFSECMNLTAKSICTITFGEGFDGYYVHPLLLGSMGYTVYNDRFFPDTSWKNIKNVYLSYEEMYKKIVDDIKYFAENKREYEELITMCADKINKIYILEGYLDNLQRFYDKKYDFYPKKKDGVV